MPQLELLLWNITVAELSLKARYSDDTKLKAVVVGLVMREVDNHLVTTLLS